LCLTAFIDTCDLQGRFPLLLFLRNTEDIALQKIKLNEHKWHLERSEVLNEISLYWEVVAAEYVKLHSSSTRIYV
jgi:hypothetical protein